ncbi:MAG: thioredoxin family protein [Pyrinomonadaceae bacterium]
MKKLLSIALSSALLGVAAFAQSPTPAPAPAPAAEKPIIAPAAAAATPAPKPKASPFPREKFDPKRDPKMDLDKAMVKAAKSGKRIILDIGGEWCGWCVYMDRFFYQNADIAKLRDKNFVWVKVNFSDENENPAFLSAFPVREGYPHLYVLDETGKLIHSQDTAPLEKGKGYDHVKFTEFLNLWSPPKGTSH